VKSVGMSKMAQLRELCYLLVATVTQLSELCDTIKHIVKKLTHTFHRRPNKFDKFSFGNEFPSYERQVDIPLYSRTLSTWTQLSYTF